MTARHAKLPPLSDVVFRRLFDDEGQDALLLHLLNALLAWPEPLMTITQIPSHRAGEEADDKEPVLDVVGRDGRGRQQNVEVQLDPKAAFRERTLFYWARLYTGQLRRGMPYQQLRPTACISIIDWNLRDKEEREKAEQDAEVKAWESLPSATSPTAPAGPGVPADPADPAPLGWHHIYELRRRSDSHLLTNHLELHYIEVPTFKAAVATLQDATDPEKEWLYFLCYTAVSRSRTRDAGPPASSRSHGSLPCGPDCDSGWSTATASPPRTPPNLGPTSRGPRRSSV